MEHSPKMFISYRRDDTGGDAGWLNDTLNQLLGSGSTFFDLSSIVPGRDFEVELKRALSQTRFLLALIGPKWEMIEDSVHRPRLYDEDDYVRMELLAAIENCVPIVPVLLNRNSVPNATDLPDVLRPITTLEAFEIRRNRWVDDVSALLKKLDIALDPDEDRQARQVSAMAEWDDIHCCSGAVILGPATRDGKAIHVSSEDQHFFPQEYLVTFIANPADPRANRYTVTDSAGEIGSEHAQNEHGLTVSGYAGGSVGILGPTLDAPFTGYRRPGLDWQLGNFYAAAFAQSARQAVEILTVGRAEYRAKSGHKTVIGKCTRGVNWVVSDRHEAFVVESIQADEKGVARYAIRAPGAMGETGGHYVVSTNNVEAKDSYNEDNVHDPGHPMKQHGNGAQNPTQFGLSGTGARFWTLMTLIQKNFGQITVEMVQEWRRTHFIYDASGTRHDYVDDGGNRIPVHLAPTTANLCRHSSGPAGVDTNMGINTYVSLSVADDLTSFRTKGRPCEWDGPWDRLSLQSPPRST